MFETISKTHKLFTYPYNITSVRQSFISHSHSLLLALTATNIQVGFKKMGIYPFNHNIFTELDFVPSYVTDRPNQNETNHPGDGNYSFHIVGVDEPTSNLNDVPK